MREKPKEEDAFSKWIGAFSRLTSAVTASVFLFLSIRQALAPGHPLVFRGGFALLALVFSLGTIVCWREVVLQFSRHKS